MAQIIIPTPLRKFTENKAKLESNGKTVLESIQQVAQSFPEIKKHLFDENNQLRNFVRIFVGDEDIYSLQHEQTEVTENTIISIVPAIAGGKN